MNINPKTKLIQDLILDAYINFERICKENGIEKIYFRGGSVMGAVKYKGFVPWDDDMDIAIPRYDFDRIRDIFINENFDGKYCVKSYHYEEKLNCYFPRLFLSEEYRKSLKLKKNTKVGLHLIDILPLDGAPNNKIIRQLYFILVYILRYLASLNTFYDDEATEYHSDFQRNIISIGRKIGLAKLFPQNFVYSILDKLYKYNDVKYSKWIGTITASLFKREVMQREIYGNGVYTDFEGIKVLIPTQYDYYLKKMYGDNYLDYQPSESEIQRKIHHK